MFYDKAAQRENRRACVKWNVRYSNCVTKIPIITPKKCICLWFSGTLLAGSFSLRDEMSLQLSSHERLSESSPLSESAYWTHTHTHTHTHARTHTHRCMWESIVWVYSMCVCLSMCVCVSVCVCVCVCVGMFMWFMRTQICIMTWVWHRYYKEKVIYEDIFSVPII